MVVTSGGGARSPANGEKLGSICSPLPRTGNVSTFALEFPKRLLLGDAFLLEWNSGLLYTFPPLPLLPRVLKKFRNDRAQVILMAPDWAQRVWYSELLGMSTCPLIRLPLWEDLLSQQLGRVGSSTRTCALSTSILGD